MTVPKIDVSYVANLARIELAEEEKILFQKQLGDILNHVELLEQVNISKVPSTPIDPNLPTNKLRSDELRPSLSTSDALANAPQKKNNLFITPRIVE